MDTPHFTPDSLIAEDIDAYLETHHHKSLLRFITCGSVDDGKSTLIGRLLYDSKMIFDDQMTALEHESKTQGTQGGDLDFALLVDGLAAEREQGITIDVAYRYFATPRRKFIVADTPGHAQYTRNMVTGASTAQAAVILIDARKGVLSQTQRHSYLVHLLGIKHVILAINKMDLVGYDQATFDRITQSYGAFARSIGITSFTAVPLSGLMGENILEPSARMPWYHGPAVLPLLETLPLEDDAQHAPFRMAVQWVNRPNLDFRGVCGLIASGTVRVGQSVRILPSGQTTQIARIAQWGGDQDSAIAGQSVTLCFADEVDCSRGDVVCAAQEPLDVADQFETSLIWMDDTALVPGRAYEIKLATQSARATFQTPKYEVNITTQEQLAVKTLDLNSIGVVTMTTDRPITFAPYAQNRDLGGFIVIDRLTHRTVAAGLIHFALRRAQNIHWQTTDITRAHHAAIKHQKPAVIWLTGLSGSGKSTIANCVEKLLAQMSRHTYLLDGDNVRHGLNKDLGFTVADRIENIRRIGEVAKLMTDAGLIVITAFISPFEQERAMVRNMITEGEFIEVFIDTPLDVAEARDVKGLYAKARRGELKNFTGIDSPYEPPQSPELHIDTTQMTAEAAAAQIVAYLTEHAHI